MNLLNVFIVFSSNGVLRINMIINYLIQLRNNLWVRTTPGVDGIRKVRAILINPEFSQT